MGEEAGHSSRMEKAKAAIWKQGERVIKKDLSF